MINFTTIETEHYKRHLILPEVGQEGQMRLKKSSVLLIGVGGLGCPAAQYLVAAGVGTITLLDFDLVERSNLQRQTLFGISQIGRNKAEAAAERLKDLNPEININPLPYALTPQNALDLFAAHHIIVDGTDNFATRYLVNDAAVIAGRPYVYGSVQRFEGQVSVFNYQNGPSYRCLFPKPPAAGSIPNCAEQGVLGVLPGIIGMMQANEVIKVILEKPGILSGKILHYNALNCSSYTIEITPNQSVLYETLAHRNTFEQQPFEIGICKTLEDIHPDALIKWFEENRLPLLIDVREPGEKPDLPIHVPELLHMPLSQLEEIAHQLPKEADAVLFCKSGIRSVRAIRILENRGHKGRLLNLAGGITALTNQFDIYNNRLKYNSI